MPGFHHHQGIPQHQPDRRTACRAEGHADTAETINQQVEKMARQVDYHLARARAASSGAAGTARTLVADSAEGLIRTLRKLHAARILEITADLPPA
ncbi:hypothetical protein [Paludibaculum fermentans]|uniref:hypothetical protein n=1 Tax=Paludibaculum fermentans TaxID=1473598 RepID=UPI003EBA9F4C